MARDGIQELLAEVLGLARADAGHVQQRRQRARPGLGHLAQRAVVEDDVGRHAAAAGDLEAQRAERVEQLAIDAFPRLALDAAHRGVTASAA